MERIILSNGVEIPNIGLGTYPLFGDVLTNTIICAYESGYRLIDTADNYYNEPDLGESLNVLYKKTDAKREDIFLVTKISDELYHPNEIGGGSNKGVYFWKNSPTMQESDSVRKVVRMKVENSLRYLKTDYLDSLLMHWPYPDYFDEIWYEMERIYKEGLIRSIGVCNCRERHFEKLLNSCSIQPMINQLETSPLNTKQNLIDYCNKKNIKVMVYSPLMNLRFYGFEKYNNYIDNLSQKYGKVKAQIVLRYDIQRGLIPIPKSTHKKRLELNIDLFNFKLTEEEMTILSKYNQNKQYLPESKSCPGI